MIWLFPYHIPYQPSTNIIPRAKALRMILVSRVDSGCDTERVIKYSLFTCIYKDGLKSTCMCIIHGLVVCLMVFNATFNNISVILWWSDSNS